MSGNEQMYKTNLARIQALNVDRIRRVAQAVVDHWCVVENDLWGFEKCRHCLKEATPGYIVQHTDDCVVSDARALLLLTKTQL